MEANLPAVAIDRVAVVAKNGSTVQGTFYRPDGTPRATVLIVAAMGVDQRFYAPLANWLAGKEYLAATFDYVGIGRSRDRKPTQVQVDILDWARFDCDAMIAQLQHMAPGKKLYWIGHSLGGQLLGVLPDSLRLAKAITVASGSGYWRENSPQLRRRAWWLWYVVAPLATRAFGYFPGRRLRKVGDLPGPVMDQWRRWCLNPDYALGAEGPWVRQAFASVQIPITSLSFTDDEMMSARNTESLHSHYTSSPRRMARIAPVDAGLERIGHFGFFRAQHQDSLWSRYLLPELDACSVA
jgi:predicted alpha/beta hydrolase